jgi:hypothetical protein
MWPIICSLQEDVHEMDERCQLNINISSPSAWKQHLPAYHNHSFQDYFLITVQLQSYPTTTLPRNYHAFKQHPKRNHWRWLRGHARHDRSRLWSHARYDRRWMPGHERHYRSRLCCSTWNNWVSIFFSIPCLLFTHPYFALVLTNSRAGCVVQRGTTGAGCTVM